MGGETAHSVIRFWDAEVGPEGWYRGDADLDATIQERFGALWTQAADGKLEAWRASAPGALAYLLVCDQFSRNLFRDTARAFATDGRARRAAKGAIAQGFDHRIEGPLRQFFYLPLTHSEIASDQERAVRLMQARLGEAGANNVLHARAHREVIRRFGRFPTRNAALGRVSSAAEQDFLESGGYGAVVRDLQGA